jgi:FkbM family methyltransferase
MHAMPAIKRLVGRGLFEVCENMPGLKPAVRKWGMRTSPEWFQGRTVRIQMSDGASFKLASLPENYLSFELFWRGGGYYEPVTTLLAQAFVQPGDTFIDVGANIGFYTLALSASHPGLRVIAFEPNPKNYRLLQANIRLNKFEQAVCEPLALSDEDGTAKLYLCASDMSASLESNFEVATSAVQVKRTSLDNYLARHPVPGRLLIKVDVEGHEAAFLSGAIQTLESRKPDIISEITSPGDSDLSTLLKQAGYRFYQITNTGLLPCEDLDLVIRDGFVFLNHLLSPRPMQEVEEMFRRIEPRVRKIDLRQTSKCVSPALLRQLQDRHREAKVQQKQVQA